MPFGVWGGLQGPSLFYFCRRKGTFFKISISWPDRTAMTWSGECTKLLLATLNCCPSIHPSVRTLGWVCTSIGMFQLIRMASSARTNIYFDLLLNSILNRSQIKSTWVKSTLPDIVFCGKRFSRLFSIQSVREKKDNDLLSCTTDNRV